MLLLATVVGLPFSSASGRAPSPPSAQPAMRLPLQNVLRFRRGSGRAWSQLRIPAVWQGFVGARGDWSFRLLYLACDQRKLITLRCTGKIGVPDWFICVIYTIGFKFRWLHPLLPRRKSFSFKRKAATSCKVMIYIIFSPSSFSTDQGFFVMIFSFSVCPKYHMCSL